MKSLAALLLVACARGEAPAEPTVAAKLDVISNAFAPGAEIPSEHTCEGADLLPPLAWTGAPVTARTYAVIVDDPDAPRGTWVHYVAANIQSSSLPAMAVIGKNDWGTSTWRGPCPPSGRHRYVFKVYALDAAIGKPDMTKDELLAAMKGHVVAKGELIGTYQKKK